MQTAALAGGVANREATALSGSVASLEPPCSKTLATGIVCAENGEHAIQCGTHIERPERVRAILKCLESDGLLGRCHEIKCREATWDELVSTHSLSHIEQVQSVNEPLLIEDDSMYLTPDSFECGSIAVGSTIELVQHVIAGTLQNGIAVVRPPGHHVEFDSFAGGFGVFNNIAVAAKAACNSGIERVLIVDWDVHHGNGTQHIFADDPRVMYFSIHRYDNGTFFPCSRDAAPEVVGDGAGQGFTVNVAWNIAWKDHEGMGDDEYMSALKCILLPIALDFRPELILVSAGFDAAAGDVGGCNVTPAGFGQMTRLLQDICPKVVLTLEGGYKLGPMSACVSACTCALLGDDVHLRGDMRPKREARLSIERTLRSLRPFWASLRNTESVDIMTATSIRIQEAAVETLDLPVASAVESIGGAEEVKQSKKSGKRKKPKEKPVTGISISTRNTANSNWKGDIKKLTRRKVDIEATLAKIDSLKHLARSRLSAKERAILENEDELKWELEEILGEVDELTSLSKDDVLRMYSGCS